MIREAEIHVAALAVQAWPEDALEVPPKRDSPSESRTPSQPEERGNSASATANHPHTELQVKMLMIEDLAL